MSKISALEKELSNHRKAARKYLSAAVNAHQNAHRVLCEICELSYAEFSEVARQTKNAHKRERLIKDLEQLRRDLDQPGIKEITEIQALFEMLKLRMGALRKS